MRPRPEVSAQPIATAGCERDVRSRPAQGARSRFARVATALAVLAWAAPAASQGGPGAERYEVTITPPKRPGSDPPPTEMLAPAAPVPSANETVGAVDVPGSADAGGAAASPEANGVPGKAPNAKPGAASTSAGPASSTAGAGSAGAGSPQVARAEANLPQRTFQVGAYRQRGSALAMRDKLAASFQDVAIVEVQSGGEALYRVHVGRLPRGAGLDDLRRRLIAAGYPAFDVPAPSAPAAN